MVYYAAAHAVVLAVFPSLALLIIPFVKNNRATFLPRYFFYMFYPGHLLLLEVLKFVI